MTSPRVSICTSVLNQSEWLKESISSVVAQTFTDWELLIFDDGSTEDIKAVVDGFKDKRIQYFRSDTNLGVPHGSNILLKKAAGEFVCILAADEVIWDKKTEVQVAFLDENPKVDCVWGMPSRFNDMAILGNMGPRHEWEMVALRAHNRSRHAWLRTLLNLESIPIGGCSLMMRKRVMDELGGFDPALNIFSDHELYVRFFEKYNGVMIPYLVARDKDMTADSVRHRAGNDGLRQLEYVRSKHPLPVPPWEGKVTVAIPCYNHAKYLPDAVNSVLNQTRPVDEILILNDASTDDFKTVVLQFTDPRIKVMAFDENRGMAEAHNQMAYRSEGEFTAFVSADDTIAPDYIEKCLAKFKENPWYEFVASQNDFMDEDGSPMVVNDDFKKQIVAIPKCVNRTREEWMKALRGGNHYFGSGMYRTHVISEVGGWEKQYKVIADYQMYLKLLVRENIGIVEEPLTHTRIHDKNDSKISGIERMKELKWLYFEARKPFYRRLMRVVICTPFYELKGFSPYITSITATIRLLERCGIDWIFHELSGDSYVHRARNNMCDQFLEDPDNTDLFFIDSDMAWNPEAFINMCMLPEGVVGGSYPVKNGWDNWTSIPELKEVNGEHRLQGRELDDGTALVEAHVLAGGFLRIKREVLENFIKHFPDLWYREPSTRPNEPGRKYVQFFAAKDEEHQFIGEDHYFSKRMRDMKQQMFIYPNVTIDHFGVKGWSGNFDTFLRNNKNEKVADDKKAA